MAIKKLLGLVCAALFAASLIAEEIELAPNHPDRYVVVKGDTLWDISGRFLAKPWLWPEVWYVNPQIENPHLIYPGDVISLVYVDGRPQLRMQRGHPHVKLSPTMREERIDQAIPTIPLDAIQQFLTQPLVVGENELESAPYLVAAADEHVMVGAGDRIYVRGITDTNPNKYDIFRPGGPYVDPDTNEILGYEALDIGNARVTASTDEITTMNVTRSRREALVGDRLLPASREEVHAYFTPHAPDSPIEGRIISVVDGVNQIGQYQVVALDLGSREGIEVGHTLAIFQTGDTVRDIVSKDPNDVVKLPDERGGELMVFRVFEKVSFGLVLKATRALHVLDIVKNP